MKLSILILSAFFFLADASAQTKAYSVSGTVISQHDGEELPGATVVLTSTTNDRALGVASDENGNFSITSVTAGKYILTVKYVGYKILTKAIHIQTGNVRLEKLMLDEEPLLIEEIEVIAKAPLGDQRGDTTIFNAKAFKTAPDASAENLIKKMPGVSIQNGVVQAQGEEVKQLMIDGKRFGGSDVSSALRSIPSDMIESVQIYDRKSDRAIFSGFDDGNREKTLNLVTRVDRRKGESGKISAGYGTDNRYMVGAALNIFNNDRKITLTGLSNNINLTDFSIGESPGGSMRGRSGEWGGGTPNGDISTNTAGLNYNDIWDEKIEINSSYNYTSRKASNSQGAFRNFIAGEQEDNQLDQQSTNINEENSHRLNLRLNYTISERDRLIISPNLTFQKNMSDAKRVSLLYGRDATILTNSENTNNGDNSTLNFSNNILYSHRFSKPGRVLTTNLTTTYGDTEQNNLFEELTINSLAPEQNIIRNQFNDIKRKHLHWSGNVSISEKVGSNSLLQVEYTIGNQTNDSDRRTFDLESENGEYTQLNVPLSSTFTSDYLAHTIGPSFQIHNEKIRFQLNAKYQYAELTSNTTYPEYLKINRNFSNLLPSLELEYKLTESRNLNVSFQTSTSVPSSEQLQEVLNISNPLQIRVGNNNLDQDYQSNLFLRYRSFNRENNSVFFLGVFGTATQNYIGNSIYENPPEELLDGYMLQPGARLTRSENMDGFWNVRSFFNYGTPLKFIKSNFNLRGSMSYSRTPGKINNVSNYANNLNINIGLDLSSNINENIDFTLSTNSNYNFIKNTNAASIRNNNYFSQNSNIRLSYIFWKGFVYRTEINNQYNTGVSGSDGNIFTVWNMSLGKKFLKDKKAEVSLSVNDLLNKNTSFQQIITESYVEDVRSTVLQRFFMLTLTYNLRSYSGDASPNRNHGIR